MDQEKSSSIQSVERSFSVLEWLAAQRDGGSLKDLCKDLALPKSTLHRLLQNLVQLGYVYQNGETGHYRLTLKLFEIASGEGSQTDILTFARPHLDSLSQQLGETVHLVLRDETDIVYVYKAESGGLRLSSRIGLRIPAYCTGVGKAILSTMPYQAVENIWKQSEITPLTPNTVTDFVEWEKQLAETRRRGWALDDEENEIGIRCVAVALAGGGNQGAAEAAFSVSALAAKMDAQRIAQVAEICLEVQQRILRDMGLAKK